MASKGEEDLAASAILRLCVILGQPFPWNVLPAANDKSLQRNAHTTAQKHKDDLKRPEYEDIEHFSCDCNHWQHIQNASSIWHLEA